jgi:4-hydroxybenzoate polyprenyltransferase
MAAYSVELPWQNLLIQTLMFAIGSTLLHSAACILNDICDRDFDRQVGEWHLPLHKVYLSMLGSPMQERTKNRPLATGVISVTGATLWLLLFVFASIMVLATTNKTA